MDGHGGQCHTVHGDRVKLMRRARRRVWSERSAARHGATLAIDLDTWLTEGERVECDDCPASERHNDGGYREVDGRTLCPMCAVKTGVDDE